MVRLYQVFINGRTDVPVQTKILTIYRLCFAEDTSLRELLNLFSVLKKQSENEEQQKPQLNANGQIHF